MSSVTPVPETGVHVDDDPGATAAWRTFRRCGGWTLLRDSWVRFRFGDGFTSARALALQVCLAFVPFVLALVGLADVLGRSTVADVLRLTLVELAPGTRSDDVVRDTVASLQETTSGDGGTVALALGLLAALVSAVTALGQVERGANRIYGVQRDRPSRQKYTVAAVNGLIATMPIALGFAMLVAGGAFGRAMRAAGIWDAQAVLVWDLVRWPLGTLLAVACFTYLFRTAPRRRQPGWTWLALGGALSLGMWLLLTALFALYLSASDVLGATYGPLTAVVALLVWALLTSFALFLGLAVAAQLEAIRAGTDGPALPDVDASAAPEQAPLGILA